jgi:peroxiredoxin Q/BCP
MAHALAVGDPAPDFTLTSQTGAVVSLAEARTHGNVVLIFYPKDQTPGCTAQLCAARDDQDAYDAANVQLYGINGDTAASHQRFIAKHNLTMPLLIDSGLVVAKSYDSVIGLGPITFVNRTVVGIDAEGTIVFYERGMPKAATILAAFG